MTSRSETIMKIRMTWVRYMAMLCLLSVSWVADSRGQSSMPGGEPQAAGKLSGMTLSELEQMALSSNPTLAQAAAEMRAADARKHQVGLYPNPTIGYQGEQIRGGIQGGGEQGFFVAQDIVLGGKLGLNRQVAEQERKLAEMEAEQQRQRVLNSVRMSYYRALASQEMLELRRKLSKLADDAVATTQQLANVGQADKPDLLQAEVESDQAELASVEAEQNQRRAWAELAVIVGHPSMPLEHLAGDLSMLPPGTSDEWLRAIVEESPAVKIAGLGVAKAKASLARARKQAIPDLQLRGGLQQNLETNETTGHPLGLQGFAEAGMQIPIFNRNQGNVGAAQADLERATQEVERVQLVLRQRAAPLVENYEISRVAVARYRDRMIPHAQEAYELYRSRYQQMAAAYPQVLIAQRTLFQLQADYITALSNLWTNSISLQGFLLTDGLGAPSRAAGIDRPEANPPSSKLSAQP
jgi:outer membrane protein, heavy metal efflux system